MAHLPCSGESSIPLRPAPIHPLFYHYLYVDYVSLFAISYISWLVPPSRELVEIILGSVTTAGDLEVTEEEDEIVSIGHTGRFLVLHRELHDQPRAH